MKDKSNLISVLAIIGLVTVTIVDLINPETSVDFFVYASLAGASLGAKFEDLPFGGKK